MKMHYFQHVPFEGLAMIREWAKNQSCSIKGTRFYEKDYRLPSTDDYDVLVVMGGPMSVHDGEKYRWLAEEKTHIQAAIDAGKYILGICLGAQQIAFALEAEVTLNGCKEIGWFPVEFHQHSRTANLLNELPETLTVMHWHGERFDIPLGAECLASSEACEQQGFLYQEKVLGLQFHLEMDNTALNAILSACSEDLTAGEYVQDAQTILELSASSNTQDALYRLLDNWLQPLLD